MWNNNVTHGGHRFVARWTERVDESDQTSDPVEEGSLAVGNADTGSTAAGFSSDTIISADGSTSRTIFKNKFIGFGFSENNASVTDIGSGRYEVSTATVAGERWLQIGVLEKGGLWGTYYENGGLGTYGEKEEATP